MHYITLSRTTVRSCSHTTPLYLISPYMGTGELSVNKWENKVTGKVASIIFL